jgi:16S rRNA processing protein RimM
LAAKPILLGVIGRPHGVRGHVHVQSHAEQKQDLAAYGVLRDRQGRQFTLRWVGAGIAEVTCHHNGTATVVADRESAALLVNTPLFLDRAALPEPEPDTFYLADLIGLAVHATDGAPIGELCAVHDYGAGASLEIALAAGGTLLVPFTRAAVPVVDPEAGRIVVDPPAELEADLTDPERESAA